MIKWKLPTKDEPGFLRRKRELSVLLDAEPTPENLDAITEYLTQFTDDDIWDCSQAEYGQAILTLMGYKNTVSDPKDESSGPQ